jgi:hypothetical protein
MRGKKAKALRRQAKAARSLLEDTVLGLPDNDLQVKVLGLRRSGKDAVQVLRASYAEDSLKGIYKGLKKGD